MTHLLLLLQLVPLLHPSMSLTLAHPPWSFCSKIGGQCARELSEKECAECMREKCLAGNSAGGSS